ncbi:hypothetical protein EMN47_02485 [Prolixibacteraceae bacterium JC049]|nr:hypothetical protein [Prolixibacteraceae bacterium JC049]
MVRIFWSILFILLVCPSFAQNLFKNAKAESQRIVLIHPTVGTIKHFNGLIEQNIIELKNAEIVGLYHEKEDYDYNQSVKYLEEKQLNNYSLHAVNAPLKLENLFQTNELTPILTEVVKKADAVLFFGGSDLPAAAYGEKTLLTTGAPDIYRHYFELSSLFQLLGGEQNRTIKPLLDLKPKLVVRAFCLGMQTMNVATGGSLFQDIPSNIYGKKYIEDVVKQQPDNIHRYYWYYFQKVPNVYYAAFHHIRLKIDGYFVNELKLSNTDNPLVNSRHHQAVKKIGQNLLVEATSMDGKVIEALSHRQYPNVIGVQFHPEDYRLYRFDQEYRIKPSQKELKPLPTILQEGEGYELHIRFWKHFSLEVMKNSIHRN